MKAKIVDLRYKMNEVLKALDRNEKVTILYHGKVKGVILPATPEKHMKVQDHHFFGMCRDEGTSVSEILEQIRGGRYHAV